MMKVAVLLLAVLVYVNCQRHFLERQVLRSMGSVSGLLPDDPKEQLIVGLAYSLRNIIDYDSTTQLLDTSGYLILSWKDERLGWNSASYGNISYVSVPCQQLQKPDIKLYNGLARGLVMDTDTNCVVTNDGTVTYLPRVDTKTFCAASEPAADTLSCTLVLGSWTHNCEQMNFTASSSRTSYLDLSNYSGGWRWGLVSTSSKHNVVFYSCCPESFCNVKIKLDIMDKSKTKGWF